ncbi:unnamed protein product [Dimorphilus gyrociliatus]|uniref:C1q domain-containing protein n=1 Tax=Dimorphilus gyrociliatus TaxID=2664684 RepID=A0A7I8WEY2_9ANNE|nr:unnamed protein product [Dimorphilus gyrociliatus]
MALKLNDSLPILFVHQSFQFSSPCSGLVNMMNFNTVIEDTTNSWDNTRMEYRVPMTGTYYVDLNIVVRSGNTVEVNVVVNGDRKFRLLKFGREHTRSEIISKGGLVQMSKNDILTIRYRGCVIADDMVSSMSILLVP